MRFYPFNHLAGQTDQEVFEYFGHCSGLPYKVVALDYGIWGIKAASDDLPDGTTFITLQGQQTNYADLGSGVTGAGQVTGVRLVNEALGTTFLFGRAAANFADDGTLVRRANSNDGLIQQFTQAAMTQVLNPGASHVALVVGLPNDDMKVESFKRDLTNKLKGLHIFSDGTKTWQVLVDLVMFQPQASGAMFYNLIDQHGVGTDEMETVRRAVTAHVTVGGGTAELLLMRPIRDDTGNYKVQPDFLKSKSRPAGVNVLRTHLRDTVFQGLTVEQMPNDAEIDDMLEGRVDRFGKQLPVASVDGEDLFYAWWDGRTVGDTGRVRGWVDLAPYIAQGEAKMRLALRRLVAETVGLGNVDVQYVFAAGGALPRVLTELFDVFGVDRVFVPGQRPGKKELVVTPPNPERIVAYGLHRYGKYELVRHLARKQRQDAADN